MGRTKRLREWAQTVGQRRDEAATAVGNGLITEMTSFCPLQANSVYI